MDYEHRRYMPGGDDDNSAQSYAPMQEEQPVGAQHPEVPEAWKQYPQEWTQPQQPAEAESTANPQVVESRNTKDETEPDQPKWVITASKVLSTVFSPVLIPTYACAMALWITTLSAFPEKNRFVIALIVFCITTLLPFGLLLFMLRTGKVSDTAISDRQERIWPFGLTLLCYLGAVVFLDKIHAPHWLSGFYAGAVTSTIASIVITWEWKVSIHAMSMGGLTAMSFYIATHNLAVVMMLPWVLSLLLLSGAVMSARLFLNRHTPAQTYVGWLLGFVIVYYMMGNQAPFIGW